MKKTLGIVFSVLILLLFSSLKEVNAQQVKVSGIVKDTTGAAVPGVSISLKGQSNIGAITDVKGHYSINVPNSKSILVFTSIGFMNTEAKVGNRTNIDLQLTPGTSNLDEVVVIGYGTQKKRDVTGAISSVSAKQIGERQATDVLDALQGQTPGVQIAQESGRPGAGSSIRIRGTATFEGGVEPLYIVDGAQGVNIDGINPADIESIEVLRDAASAAIYGSRSANGVIIITTKRGKDGKPRVEFRTLTSIAKIAHKIPEANAADQHYLSSIRGIAPGSSGIDTLNPSFNADNNYQDLLTQTGMRNQVDFSVSGGSKQLNYFGSFGLLKDKGILLNSFSDIGRGRFNIDYKPNEKFAFGTRLQVSYRTDNRLSDASVLQAAVERPPSFRVYLPDGSLAPPLGGSYNPVADALLRKNNFQIYDASLYNYLSYNFTKDLKFTVDANVSVKNTHNLSFAPNLLSNVTPPINTIGDSLNLTTYWQVQGYFNYAKTLAQKHNISAVLGVSADQGYNQNSYQSGTNLVSESVLTLNSAQVVLPSKTYQDRSFSNSIYGRVGYSYLGKYLINATMRADASSRFAPENRWGYFPSASVGWRFSDESFMNWSKKYLDDGKLRVSYGLTGNDRIGPYTYINQYVIGNDFYGGISGVAPNSALGNKKLSWESTEQLNIGADLAMLKGKLNVSVDVYNKTTSKLLYSAPLSKNTGYQTSEVNVGSIRNTGVELLINANPIRNKNFSWNITYNMSFNKNKVLQLYHGTDMLPGNPNLWKVSVGGHLGDFYGYKSLGVYAYNKSNAYSTDWTRLTPVVSNGAVSGYTLDGKPYTGTVNALTYNGFAFQGGDVIWQNTRKDSVIDDNDRVILGNAIPNWTGDIGNTFTYKQFTLTFNFYISWGNQLYNGLKADQDANNAVNTMPDPTYIRGAWVKEGDATIYPRTSLNSGLDNGRNGSSAYIEDASFIRFRNIRLTYQVPRIKLSKLKISAVGIYVYANNIATWTKYSSYDPEMSLSSALTPGNDVGRYPKKKELGLGLNVTF